MIRRLLLRRCSQRGGANPPVVFASITVASALGALIYFLVPTVSGNGNITPSAPIRHVVFIDLENHSYDNVMGAICQTHSAFTGTINGHSYTDPARTSACNGGPSSGQATLSNGSTYTIPFCSGTAGTTGSQCSFAVTPVPQVNHTPAAQAQAIGYATNTPTVNQMDGFDLNSGGSAGTSSSTGECGGTNINWHGSASDFHCIFDYQRPGTCSTYCNTHSDIPNAALAADTYATADNYFSPGPIPSWGSHLELATGGYSDGFEGINPNDLNGWGCDSGKTQGGNTSNWSPTGQALWTQEPACVPTAIEALSAMTIVGSVGTITASTAATSACPLSTGTGAATAGCSLQPWDKGSGNYAELYIDGLSGSVVTEYGPFTVTNVGCPNGSIASCSGSNFPDTVLTFNCASSCSGLSGITGQTLYAAESPAATSDSNWTAQPASERGFTSNTPSDPVPWTNSIFNLFDSAGLSWKVYNDGCAGTGGCSGSDYIWATCPTLGDCIWSPQRNNLTSTGQIICDAVAGTLPNFALVTPWSGGTTSSLGCTNDAPAYQGASTATTTTSTVNATSLTGLGAQCSVAGSETSEHNDAGMDAGDNWLGCELNALTSGPEWSSTAVFITWDDYGGFYDHVPPPLSPIASGGYRKNFLGLGHITQNIVGLRTPLIIVSPWTTRDGSGNGYVDHKQANQNGILAFTEHLFGLKPLTLADAQAYDFSQSFCFAPTCSSHAEKPTWAHTKIPKWEQTLLAKPRVYDPVNDST